jgi:hypothetical protein
MAPTVPGAAVATRANPSQAARIQRGLSQMKLQRRVDDSSCIIGIEFSVKDHTVRI